VIPSATQIRRLNGYEAGALPRRCSVEAFVLEIIATQRALAGLKREGGVILRMIVEGFDQQEIAVRIRVAPRTVSNRLNKLLSGRLFGTPIEESCPQGDKADDVFPSVPVAKMRKTRKEKSGQVLQRQLPHEGLSRGQRKKASGVSALRKKAPETRASSWNLAKSS